MKGLPYNVEVSHCVGAKRRICTRCYRYALLKMWEQMSVESRETILLFPGRAEGVSCGAFYDVEKVSKRV